MIQDMPRPRPPHLQRELTRYGVAVWYVRIGKGPRVRIRAPFGTPEFDVEYQAALTASPRPAQKAPLPGTLAWLIARYRETTGWSDLSLATRRQRENIFLHVLETAGDQSVSKITAKAVLEGRDRRAATPAQARNFWMRPAAYSAGPIRRDWSKSTRPRGSRIRSAGRVRASRNGPRRMALPTKRGGRSAPRRGSGSRCC